MTIPPTTNDPTDRARDDDADWARWEQTFRDAKPVLPEAAMARIEASILRETQRVVPPKPTLSRLRRRILFLIAGLVAINLFVFWFLSRYPNHDAQVEKSSGSAPAATIIDRYPMDVPIGPQLVAPDVPILSISAAGVWIPTTGGILPTIIPSSQPTVEPPIVRAAERLPTDGWHALGLLEMRRAAGISVPLPTPHSGRLYEYYLGLSWDLLPLSEQTINPFRIAEARFGLAWLRDHMDQDPVDPFWKPVFHACLAEYTHATQSSGIGLVDAQDFPSRTVNRARFDLLVELGVPNAQAALIVLTTRSYKPLDALRSLDGWITGPSIRDKLREKYLSASHEFFERQFALRLMGRDHDADELLSAVRKIRYLTDPQDMAVLLARLGPDVAWDKLLRPLMEDEARFIQNPPNFDDTSPRPSPEVTVEARSKSVREGVASYLGPIQISAGPWRIACKKLTAFHDPAHGVLLSGDGAITVHGIIGLLSASADEFTLNTETGELKLSGHVHLDGWTEPTDAKSCTIIRTGEVRDVQQ